MEPDEIAEESFLLLGIVVDCADRQRLLQLDHTHVCYFGADQVKYSELLQFGWSLL